MAILIFRSEKDASFFGFTRTPDGSDLPATWAPWKRTGTLPDTGSLPGIGPVLLIEAQVSTGGFCVVRVRDESETDKDTPIRLADCA